jgi:hypothetical protein
VTLAGGLVLARVAFTRINSDVALLSGVSGLAEAGKVADAWFVTAHGTIRTWVVATIGIFNLAVDARVSFVTFTSEI